MPEFSSSVLNILYQRTEKQRSSSQGYPGHKNIAKPYFHEKWNSMEKIWMKIGEDRLYFLSTATIGTMHCSST